MKYRLAALKIEFPLACCLRRLVVHLCNHALLQYNQG